tara:strand:+ start:1076 stop:1258 length:183 start_codon:yes stop_codon:yes gene_type:complete
MAYPTNPIYKLIKNSFTDQIDQVKTQVDNVITIIPFEEENTDYQEYLEWVAEGNTAEAAD